MNRRFDPSKISDAVRGLLLSLRLSPEHAAYVADTLVDTSLSGIDTHGIRLLPTYVRELEGGRSRARPQFRLEDHQSFGVLHADGALGVVAANKAMRLAIERAATVGVCAISVRDSNHFGAAGYYARLASRREQIGFAFSNSDALVVPANGLIALNGTNPLAMAAPGLGDDGFFLDMATSQHSYSRVLADLGISGADIPAPGSDGTPKAALPLQPLGGYKGQGLGTMVQVLCALLTDMPTDSELAHLYAPPYDQPRQIGHFFIAIDIAAFTDPGRFRKRISDLLSTFRRSPGAGDQAVVVAGDPEAAFRAERARNGLELGTTEYALLEAFLS